MSLTEKLIKSKIKSELGIKNNKIYLSQKKSQINGTDIKFQGYIDVGKTGGFPFKFESDFYDLNLNPFVETFVSGNYKTTKGKIDKFVIFIEGKGMTKSNLKKHLNGELNVKLTNLSLPYQIEQYKLLKILIIPMEILSKMREMIPGGFLVSNLEMGIQETKNIFKNLDNINLASGEIYLIANNGKVHLDKVYFKGNKSDVIKYSDFSGTVDYDGNLEIKTKLRHQRNSAAA